MKISISPKMVVLIGLILSLIAFLYTNNTINTKKKAEFAWIAHNHNKTLKKNIENTLEVITSVKDLFRASQNIDAIEFNLFAASLLSRHQGIQTLMWIPNMENSPRDTPYLPVMHVEPKNESEILLGLNLGKNPIYRSLFNEARTSKKMVISQRIPIPHNNISVFGFMAIQPTFKHESQTATNPHHQEKLLGYAIGIFRFDKLAEESTALLEPQGIALVLLDESAPTEKRFLDFHTNRLNARTTFRVEQWQTWLTTKQPQITETFQIANRTWSITCAPTLDFNNIADFPQAPWIILMTGIMTSLMLYKYFSQTNQYPQQQQAIKQSQKCESTLRHITDTLQEIIWIQTPPKGQLLYINARYQTLFGHSPDLLKTQSLRFLRAIHPEDRRRVLTTIKQIGRIKTEIVFRISQPDMNNHWIRCKTLPVFTPEGNILHTIGVAEEITEIKQAETALLESEKKMRALFYQSPDIIHTVDRDGTILLINRETTENTQVNSIHLFPISFRNCYQEHLHMAFQNGESTRFDYTTPNGLCWNARIVPIRRDSQVVAAMLVTTDVTENRILQSQAIQNARLASIGMLAAGVAHEINNPNSAIYYNASMVAGVWRDALPILDEYYQENGECILGGLPYSEMRDKTSQILDWIIDNSNRIKKIVANLKHMARNENSGLNRKVDVVKIIKSTMLVLNHQIQTHTDHFVCTLPDHLPNIQGNSQQLEQVLINIILNALQALPNRKHQVMVSVLQSKDDPFITITIADNGVGIIQEHMEKITDPFFTTRTEQGGTGLGLSISYDVVRRHQGTMHFQSIPNHGTTVTIRLPIKRSSEDTSDDKTTKDHVTNHSCG